LLWWAVGRFGIEGAAIAWTARVTVDTLAILFLTRSLDGDGAIVGRVLWPMAVALGWMLVGASTRGTMASGAFLAVTYVGLVPVAWRFLLRADERALLLRSFRA
jgi:O-antigen/teichoic acid export membrane protein